MSRTPGPCRRSVGDVAGHGGERAERIDGVEVAEEENRLGFFAAGEIDLQVVAEVGGGMNASAFRRRLRSTRRGTRPCDRRKACGRWAIRSRRIRGWSERVCPGGIRSSGGGQRRVSRAVFSVRRRSSWRALGLNPGDPWCSGRLRAFTTEGTGEAQGKRGNYKCLCGRTHSIPRDTGSRFWLMRWAG